MCVSCLWDPSLGYAYKQMSPSEGAPEEFDQTIFAVRKDRTIGPAEGLALNLVKEQQRYYLCKQNRTSTSIQGKKFHIQILHMIYVTSAYPVLNT